MAHRERISWSFTGSPSGKLRKPRAATVLARALPRRGSFCNLSNGNTASLAPWWLNFLSLSFRSSSLAPSIRRVARRAYGDRSAYSLTLAFDDSLKRVAYGSRACYKPWRPEAPCGNILLWAFPHIYVRSGYILWVARFTPFPPNLIKRHHSAAPRGHYP